MTYEQALNQAAAYCSRAERAEQDIRKKLEDWGMSEEEAEKIIEWLRHERFLDEGRYLHAFINDKFTYEHWGRIKIVYALRQKGITGSAVQNMLDDTIDPDLYLETLTDLLRAKMRGMALPLQPKERAKLYRFAAQRGFESNSISQALSRLHIPDDE